MKKDQYLELVSEIHPEGHPANYGNAMAETARYAHLWMWAGSYIPDVNLKDFRTDTTYLQSPSPNCPSTWTDSSDQCLPFFLAMQLSHTKPWGYSIDYAAEMKARIKSWN